MQLSQGSNSLAVTLTAKLYFLWNTRIVEAAVPASRRAIVIHSPYSGRSELLSQALIYLQQTGVEVVQAIPISELDGLPPQGPVWLKHGFSVAIAAGGDGVIGGVITHIAENGPPLGILPLGTSNDIARS